MQRTTPPTTSQSSASSPLRVLVTGASGFVGSNLVRRFEKLGWLVHGTGRRSLSSVYNYHPLDLASDLRHWPRSMFQSYDVIVHAAARSSPWGSHQEFRRDNIIATSHMLQFAQQTGAKKFIFISSSSVFYKPEDQLGITEETPFAKKPVNRYAATKQDGERLVCEAAIPWCILRPRAVYGVGDTVLFPRIVKAARAGRFPLIVREDGPVVGDLLSIRNLVDICEKSVARSDIQGTFNLTDNHSVEIIPFLLSIFEHLGLPTPTRKLSARTAYWMAGAIERFYGLIQPNREPPITRFGVHVFAYSKTFDVSKMLTTFGQPRYSVDKEVEAFVQWIKERGEE